MTVSRASSSPLRTVLVSGAGIAGPALAFWLQRLGIEVTVVERAPALREGGQAVDFRGPVHLGVLERMGVLETIRARRTRPGELVLLGRDGTPATALPASFTGGEIEILRGDLSRVFYEAGASQVEYLFGDEITALDARDDGVDVRFARAAARSFDLVIGADGQRSKVRALAFGEETQFLRHLDHHVAGFPLPNFLGLDRGMQVFSAPGRGVALSAGFAGGELRALLVFRSPPLAGGRLALSDQKDILYKAFAGMGWHTGRILAALDDATDLYFDAVSLVEVPSYSRGRVALLGDAGYGGTMGGNGTGLAVLGAYVLAGELAAARTGGHDHAWAFGRYEDVMRPYATRCQSGAKHAGPFFAPKGATQLFLRDHLYGVLASRPFARLLDKLTTRSARGIELPTYAV